MDELKAVPSDLRSAMDKAVRDEKLANEERVKAFEMQEATRTLQDEVCEECVSPQLEMKALEMRVAADTLIQIID